MFIIIYSLQFCQQVRLLFSIYHYEWVQINDPFSINFLYIYKGKYTYLFVIEFFELSVDFSALSC